MAQSILNSIKKVVNLHEADDSFDLDVMMHINAVFSILDQLGIGPAGGFMIEDETSTWDDFLESGPLVNMVKTYVYLRVRLLFDAPGTSYAIESMNEQIKQIEWRMSVYREGVSWTDPTLPVG